MKICGIVAEYNPFHNGHKYQIEEIKKKTNCDAIVAIMSGNFMQRGVPASFDKWTRAKMAIDNGVDLVIELPTLYATASAEYFALGAVSLLNSLNSIDYISFGVKNDNLELLNKIADVLANEPEDYKKEFQKELKNGVSFPVARSKCLQNHFKNEYDSNLIEEIMIDSNNILAIEYLKALKNLQSSISPILVKRNGPDYNSLDIVDSFCSSTAIREALNNHDLNKIQNVVPLSTLKTIEHEIDIGKVPMNLNNFEKEILYVLRRMDAYSISTLADVNEGLENVIKKSLQECFDLESLINEIKSKRYTRTRIERILVHALLGIRDNYLKKNKSTPKYARILGFSKQGKKVLSEISKNSSIPIVTSVSSFIKKATDEELEMLNIDIEASNIYTLGYPIPKHRINNYDLTAKIIEG
ncbi:MAG: nucleotidyltransferase [Clostridia bacterium]|nr:nucleotidyltransferase [Clostridia bacterium]